MLTLLYVVGFLDRGNIGNAKVAGMNDDLGELHIVFKHRSSTNKVLTRLVRSSVQYCSDCFLLPVRLLRGSEQCHSQATPALDLDLYHDDILGYSTKSR